MKKFIEGAKNFQANVFPKKENLFHELVDSQTPWALLITCSDSRIDPNLISQSEPGELFIIRVAGNLVPSYQLGIRDGISASIEYAVTALEVPHIIVCGHSNCGAMTALISETLPAEMPVVVDFLQSANDVAERVNHQGNTFLHEGDKLKYTIETNVAQQLEHLKTHPSVQQAMTAGQLELHGCVYDISTGEVQSVYNFPEQSKVY